MVQDQQRLLRRRWGCYVDVKFRARGLRALEIVFLREVGGPVDWGRGTLDGGGDYSARA